MGPEKTICILLYQIYLYQVFSIQRLISYRSEGGISDKVLLAIAESISDESKITGLGYELGFKYADIDRALKTNRVDGQVTSKGTHRMLQVWKERTPKQEQWTTLKEALEGCGFTEVAEDHLLKRMKTLFFLIFIV